MTTEAHRNYLELRMERNGNLAVRKGEELGILMHRCSELQECPDILGKNNQIVVRQDSFHRVWKTDTDSNPDSFAVLHDDGDLAVYSPTGQTLWSSMRGSNVNDEEPFTNFQ